ncbi:hypothetical protein [Labilibaculum sp.]|uniref:hypothetical protein n=1 Tax=Labilibaculum sp. TaxID=2060723 RepID=UPI00356B4EAC
MKNRNTKDVAENHIYPFMIAIIVLFVAIFFSLNSAKEAALLLYTISINLIVNWLFFYASKKKKLTHFSEFHNNMVIGTFTTSAILPVFIIIPLVLVTALPHLLLLLLSLILSFTFNKIILLQHQWESKAEQILSYYRMNIEEKKELAFQDLKKFIDHSGVKKFEDYIDKNQMFDKKMEDYLKSKRVE